MASMPSSSRSCSHTLRTVVAQSVRTWARTLRVPTSSPDHTKYGNGLGPGEVPVHNVNTMEVAVHQTALGV